MRTLLTVAFWIYFVVVGIPCFAVAVAIWIVTLPFDPQRRANHRFTGFWARLLVAAYPGWRLSYSGREKIDPARAYVLAANHSSFADVILLYGLDRQYKWVSKHTVFWAPLVGWNMALCRYVSLRRGQEDSIQRMMEECRRWLKSGMSIMMFPEGTRSRDGTVGRFKHGAFTLALEAGVPVVPIAVHGTAAVMPKHGAGVAVRADLHVEVLDPVPPDGFTDPNLYAEAVRARICAALGQSPDLPEPAPARTPEAR